MATLRNRILLSQRFAFVQEDRDKVGAIMSLSLPLKPPIFPYLNTHIHTYTYKRRFYWCNLLFFCRRNCRHCDENNNKNTGKEKRATGKSKCVGDMPTINPSRGEKDGLGEMESDANDNNDADADADADAYASRLIVS